MIGPDIDLTYDYEHLGDNPSVINQLISGKHPFSKKLNNAKKPLIIVGSDTLERPDGAAILSALQKLASQKSGSSEWRVLNVLHKVASQVAALDIGYKPGVSAISERDPKVLYLLGADECSVQRENLPQDCFVIYQGIESVMQLVFLTCNVNVTFRTSRRLRCFHRGRDLTWGYVH